MGTIASTTNHSTALSLKQRSINLYTLILRDGGAVQTIWSGEGRRSSTNNSRCNGTAQQNASDAATAAQEKTGHMKDMTQEKASQGTDATKGMGQSIMGKAQEGEEQTGSFFQQAGDK